jgi:hypothetical protein
MHEFFPHPSSTGSQASLLGMCWLALYLALEATKPIDAADHFNYHLTNHA